MSEKMLLTFRDPGIAVLTFNRPDARNALDLDAMRQFARTVDQLHSEPNLRVVIVTGAGETAFCAGADLVEMSARPSAEDGAAMISLMGDALLHLEQIPVPVIAAINGYALGGGGEVALACDLRVVDETARLGFVQAKRGVIPGWGGGQRLLRQVGYARAMELLLSARTLTPVDLEALGLLARPIAPAGKALDAALSFASEIAALDPMVVRATKHLLQTGLTQPYADALTVERSLFPPLWAGDARQQATRAFLERPRP
ncbi:MAG: enoyl-CoA hydratase/isomerase family protein [Anaerolineae bacterium]